MVYYSRTALSILKTPRPLYTSGGVEVSATPDLYVEDRGVRRLIKLDFNQQKPKERAVEIILKVMHEAASSQQLGITPKDVVYLDVSRQAQYTGARLNKSLKKEIDAALATIQDMWPGIKQG
jgi:hypothetical protein